MGMSNGNAVGENVWMSLVSLGRTRWNVPENPFAFFSTCPSGEKSPQEVFVKGKLHFKVD